MNDYSPTFLFSRMFHCLFIVYQQNGYKQFVNRAANLSMQAAVEEVEAFPHYSAQGEVSVHTRNIKYCCCTTFQYSFSVTLPFHCSGLSQMLVMILLPMPITQLCRDWLEGIRECGIGLVYMYIIHHVFVCYTSNLLY